MKSTYLEILTLTSILITHTFFKKIICFKASRFLETSKNTMNSIQLKLQRVSLVAGQPSLITY